MRDAKVTTTPPALTMQSTAALRCSRPEVSIIVPLFNEQESVRLLYAAILQAMGALGRSFELVLVDDGSSDRTVAIARELARCDARLSVIRFARNYGQTPAMAAGIHYARGEILVTMDGDLQNDPADIGLLLNSIAAGFDIAVGWRHERQDKLLTRRLPSQIANWLIGKVTGVPIHDNGCSLKAFRADLIKNIPLYSEMHRFIPAMASLAGPRVAEIKVRHHPRRYGHSKYGLSRIYKVLLDLMLIKTVATFASRPLRWFALLSVPMFIAGMAALGQTIAGMLTPHSGMPLPLAGTGVIFLSSAVILLCNGVLAELVYSRGDTRDREFLRLTQTIRAGHDNPGQDNPDKGNPGERSSGPDSRQ